MSPEQKGKREYINKWVASKGPIRTLDKGYGIIWAVNAMNGDYSLEDLENMIAPEHTFWPGFEAVKTLWLEQGYGITSPLKSWSLAQIKPVLQELDETIFMEGVTSMACTICGEEGHYAPTCKNRTGSKVGKKTTTKKRSIPVWQLVEEVIPQSRLTLLFGPPGTGKTTAANKIGDVEKVYNLTVTEETPAAELRGHFIPKGNEFVWHDGPAMRAFKEGARLVLNELDKASGDTLTFCHALCDDPGIARITLPTGESVSPHPNFSVVATMNGEPSDLPDALRDRFAVAIEIKSIHPEAIKLLSEDLRTAAKNGLSYDQNRSLSLRAWLAFDKLREALDEEKAAKAIFGARAETILNTIKIEASTRETKE